MEASKHGPIGPSSSLFDQLQRTRRRVGNGLTVRDVVENPVGPLSCEDLQAHDPVLSQIHVGLLARGDGLFLQVGRETSQELVQRVTFDGIPSECTERSG